MRCERLQKGWVVLLLLAACGRESSVPLPPAETPPVTSTTGEGIPPVGQSSPAPLPSRRTYEDAMIWFRSTPGFHFVVEEGGIRVEGDLTRERVGQEQLTALAEGQSWSARSGPKGVTWQTGGKDVAAPPWGNRLFQRVTVAFDPQKQEGEAQLLEPGHYRFTDANSLLAHDVWISEAGHIERMTIGEAFSMTLSRQR